MSLRASLVLLSAFFVFTTAPGCSRKAPDENCVGCLVDAFWSAADSSSPSPDGATLPDGATGLEVAAPDAPGPDAPAPDAGDPDAAIPAWCRGDHPGIEVNGERRWPWRFEWTSAVNASLASVCASYGDDAHVEITADVLAAGAKVPLIIKADCAAAALEVELPSQQVFHGHVVVQSPKTGKKWMSNALVNNDVHCVRSVRFAFAQPRATATP